MITWNELREAQRRCARWTEPWATNLNELTVEIEEDGRKRVKHLAYFADREVAELVRDVHNNFMFLVNALLMHEKGTADKTGVNAADRRETPNDQEG